MMDASHSQPLEAPIGRRSIIGAGAASAAAWWMPQTRASQTHATGVENGAWFSAFGLKMQIQVSASSTGGAMSATRVITMPGSGPPAHMHTREDEVFVILRGHYRFWQKDQPTIDAPAGAVVRQHKGMVHQYRNVSDQEGEHILICLPGGLEELFVSVAKEGLVVPQDMKRVVELSAQYGLSYTAPIAPQ